MSLDIGSGCGKFCLIFAASGKGSVTGIEQRPTLHRVAEDTSRSMGLTDVRFLCGRMENLDWSEFNMFYFFNPFYERIAHRSGMDDRTPYNAGLFFEHVKTVRDKLSTVRSGSRVVTYHGMGGHLANDWQMIRSDDICTDEIQLWVKA
jgi:predicted RNA methylase